MIKYVVKYSKFYGEDDFFFVYGVEICDWFYCFKYVFFNILLLYYGIWVFMLIYIILYYMVFLIVGLDFVRLLYDYILGEVNEKKCIWFFLLFWIWLFCLNF